PAYDEDDGMLGDRNHGDFAPALKKFVKKVCPQATHQMYVITGLGNLGQSINGIKYNAENINTVMISIDEVRTMAHELGHGIGDLADEYPKNKGETAPKVNVREKEAPDRCSSFLSDGIKLDTRFCSKVPLLSG